MTNNPPKSDPEMRFRSIVLWAIALTLIAFGLLIASVEFQWLPLPPLEVGHAR